MAEKKNKGARDNSALKDVEPGSDADETPIAVPGKTPPDPNARPSQP